MSPTDPTTALGVKHVKSPGEYLGDMYKSAQQILGTQLSAREMLTDSDLTEVFYCEIQSSLYPEHPSRSNYRVNAHDMAEF